MELNLNAFAFLLIVTAVVAIVATRLRLPYSVGLVLAGVALASLPLHANFPITQRLLFLVLLPPLVFETAYHMSWRALRRDLPMVLILATVGVAIAALITAAGMHWLVKWSWISALAFGMLIAATDPVSVIAAFKEAKVGGRLELLLVAESLFNDGTAAVGFSVVLLHASGQDLGHFGAFGATVVVIMGSVLCGLLVSGAALLLAKHTPDHLLHVTLATVAAYGSFLLAENFQLSGVLATLVSGLACGNIGVLSALTPRGNEAISAVFEFMAFVANSLVFLFIGVQCAAHPFWTLLMPVVVAIVLVVLGRAATVYGICALFTPSPWQVERWHQHMLVWGGLRGALALALALGLPTTFPDRDEIIAIAFAVVAFSIFVQGTTMMPLLRHRPGSSDNQKTLRQPYNE
ncbi:MAG TPA: sodium:proton antiporter [Dyella sp.]|nr:sodium:proton antiporter [Dyella sp.]